MNLTNIQKLTLVDTFTKHGGEVINADSRTIRSLEKKGLISTVWVGAGYEIADGKVVSTTSRSCSGNMIPKYVLTGYGRTISQELIVEIANERVRQWKRQRK